MQVRPVFLGDIKYKDCTGEVGYHIALGAQRLKLIRLALSGGRSLQGFDTLNHRYQIIYKAI
jgi:hypothetical protein